jgi:hypothetical protein
LGRNKKGRCNLGIVYMRKLTAARVVAGATFAALPAFAADVPFYPPIVDIPDVDYGVEGSFYLRGSAGLNMMWSREIRHRTLPTGNIHMVDAFGYGYSFGVGAGYELGNGVRFDATIDHLANNEMRTTLTAYANGALTKGEHKLQLRSTVLLANAYYDFGLGGGGYGAAGGPFGYVGAGAGVAFNRMHVTGSATPDTWGENTSLAAAGMVGVGYDFGQVVADVGYRALYINNIDNGGTNFPYTISDNWVHEVRGTVRYRFN